MANPSVRHDGARLQTILPPDSTVRSTQCSASDLLCSHETLLSVDQRTPYTAVSNGVMRHIISNRAIACCSSLWLLIRFEQSGFHDREYVTRTIGWLADALNVSTSTIQKWQRRLVELGYLEIVEQRIDGHHNAPNRYRACLPKAVAESLLNSVPSSKQRSVDRPKSTMDAQEQTSPDSKPDRIKTSAIDDLFSQTPAWFRMLLPVLRFEVVDHLLWVTGVNPMAQQLILESRTELLNRVNELGYTLQGLSFNRDQISQSPSLTKELNQPVPKKQSLSPPDPLNPHTKHRLLKLIQAARINGAPLTSEQAKRLCHEVVYAMASGSLSELPTLKAMHVALKLIRQNRWRTPYGFIPSRQ